MRRALTENLRFLLGLGGVAVGAALFAIAFRLSLAWLYRSLYQADNVVDASRICRAGCDYSFPFLPRLLRASSHVCGTRRART